MLNVFILSVMAPWRGGGEEREREKVCVCVREREREWSVKTKNRNYSLNGATTLGTTTFNIMILSINGLYVTLSLNDSRHNNAMPLYRVSHYINYYAECHYADCYYA
jgi:hypothetical protein